MDLQARKVARVVEPEATSDGAGVKLKRSIASQALDYLDPFLLFDHFGSDNSDDYIAGFSMHPHRGIETVTYHPTYLDISVPANTSFNHPIPRGHTAFAYVFAGEGIFGITDDDGKQITAPHLVVFDDGDQVKIRALEHVVRFLLISGKPLNEPIARYGPFVMNTEEEIEQALMDLRRGTFVR